MEAERGLIGTARAGRVCWRRRADFITMGIAGGHSLLWLSIRTVVRDRVISARRATRTEKKRYEEEEGEEKSR